MRLKAKQILDMDMYSIRREAESGSAKQIFRALKNSLDSRIRTFAKHGSIDAVPDRILNVGGVKGKSDKEIMQHYPLETVPLGFSGNDYMVISMIEDYYRLGQPEKARILATQLGNELLKSAKFYIEFYNWAREEFEIVGQYIYFLADVMKSAGDADLSKQLTDGLVALVDAASDALDS